MYDVLILLMAFCFGFFLAAVTGIKWVGLGVWLRLRFLPRWLEAMDEVREDERRGGGDA